MRSRRRILAFDCAYGPLLAVLLEESEVIAQSEAAAAATARAEALVPALHALLQRAGWRWHDLDLLAVGHGPGSFTGIRAAVAAARGLALATGCPLLPLGTLDLLEQSARARRRLSGSLLVLAPGKRGSWYARRYLTDGVPAGPAREMEAQALCAEAAAVEAVVGVRVAHLAASMHPTPVHESGVEVQGLVRLIAKLFEAGCQFVRGEALEPFYLRGADADPRAGLPLLARVAG